MATIRAPYQDDARSDRSRAPDRGPVAVVDPRIRLAAEFGGDVPDRNMRAHVSGRSDDGSHRRARHAERQKILRSRVKHGMDVGTGIEHGAVNEPFDAERPGVVHDRISIERELNDVPGFHQAGASRARQKVTIGGLGVTNADVSILVEDALLCQDPTGDCELVPGALQRVHGIDFLAGAALTIAVLP